MLVSFSPVSLKFTSLKETGILFIQQHLPKVSMGWWHTPQQLYQPHWGGPVAWIHFSFPWTKGQIQLVCVSSGRDVPWACKPRRCPVSLGHWDCALFPCSIPAPLPAPLLPWAQMCSFSSRCIAALGKSLIGADADFCFSRQNARDAGALGRQEEVLPPYTLSPVSSWWLCRHLPNFPVPGALLPNKATFHSASEC